MHVAEATHVAEAMHVAEVHHEDVAGVLPEAGEKVAAVAQPLLPSTSLNEVGALLRRCESVGVVEEEGVEVEGPVSGLHWNWNPQIESISRRKVAVTGRKIHLLVLAREKEHLN
jgi:hypothetical protein